MLAGNVGWFNSWVTKVLLLLLLQLYCSLKVASGEILRDCFRGNEEDDVGEVFIECTEGHVIEIHDTFFGRNRWGGCFPVAGDCVVKTQLFASCGGQRGCAKRHKTYSSKCGYSTFLILKYSCKPSSISELVTSTPMPVSASSLDILNIVQNRTRSPAVYTIAPDVKEKNEQQEDEFRETAIIVGCVIASVVIVIALIVAIVLVVRRLLQKKLDSKEDSQSEKDCSETTCINLDMPCFKPGPTNEQAQREIKSAKRTINKTPSFRTFTGKTKTRMAPVGEESGADHVAAHSESNLTSSPKCPYSGRVVLHNDSKHTTWDHFSQNGTVLIVEPPPRLQKEVKKRSLKRDAKNNNIDQKDNKNIKTSSVSNKVWKATDNFNSVAANNEATTSAALAHKTDDLKNTAVKIEAASLAHKTDDDAYKNASEAASPRLAHKTDDINSSVMKNREALSPRLAHKTDNVTNPAGKINNTNASVVNNASTSDKTRTTDIVKTKSGSNC